MDKNERASTKNTCSDFEHLKVWQDNQVPDYYLSDNHWNSHVNIALHRLIAKFYDNIGVYEYLGRQLTNDRDAFYGIMLNEAYRLCQIVITSAVPDAKVAMLFIEAETLLFRDWIIPVGCCPPQPNNFDKIMSYHILGMVNAILSLANDQKDSIDRFLYNLSLYSDEGVVCYGKQQSFETYYKQYEQFVVVGLILSSALRPGYEYKEKDEHLRKTILWYKIYAEEIEKKKEETDAKKTYTRIEFQIRWAVKKLMDVKNDKGEYLVYDKDQHYAIKKVLVGLCGLPPKKKDYDKAMINLRLDNLRIPYNDENIRKIFPPRINSLNVTMWYQYINTEIEETAKQARVGVKLVELLEKAKTLEEKVLLKELEE